jgi:hypothetical protein
MNREGRQESVLKFRFTGDEQRFSGFLTIKKTICFVYRAESPFIFVYLWFDFLIFKTLSKKDQNRELLNCMKV